MLLDGKKVRDELLNKYKNKISSENIKAKLAIIMVGDNDASKIYIRNKEKYCKYVGIDVEKHLLDANCSEKELISLINKLNRDDKITGIILQSPIPKQIDFKYVSNLIDFNKDIDGFTEKSIYNLYNNTPIMVPCTVKGIIRLLDYYDISLEGKNVLIIGRGYIVGRPLSMALLNRNATVTIAHSKTKNLGEKVINSDIIISAAGVPNLITKDMVNKNSILLDVGITRIDNKIKGDIDFDNVYPVCKWITPNPGGIGPMTIAMIIENIIIAYERER